MTFSIMPRVDGSWNLINNTDASVPISVSATSQVSINSIPTNALFFVETTVGFADLASAGTKIIQASSGSSRFKVRGITLSANGANFSGGGGNRNIAIQDSTGSVTYTVITAALAQSLAATRWGDSGVPFPATASQITTATAAGKSLVLKYSGGTTDYTAGSLTVIVLMEKVA